MEKNKKIIKLCYLQIAFYVVFLTSLLLHFKRGLDHRAFALLIILTLLGCASALTLTDYLKSLIRRSGFDVAGVHDKKSLEEKLLQLQNADDTLDVGVMMFDMNNLKMINDTYGHEEGDVFIQTFASYLTRILTENSFLARFGGDEFVIVQNHATWNQLEQMNLQLQTMIDTYNQTADHPLSYAVGYELSCKNHYYLIMDLLQMADEKMYQDKRYKKQLQKNGPLAARRSMLAESISTDSLKEKIFTLLNNRSEEKQYAFLMTDVDNFHLINDYWGYEMGTNILNFILKKLELFPQTLFVNRYHSDIFVGIIDITWQDPAVVREKISAYHKQAIRFFHDRNIRISMDDFGSGYSSLNSLKDILFDEVKIDKHFLSAGLSEKGKIVLEEMFHLLKRTDKWIVCEGVETKEMVDFLIAEGCDELQGF
jgi:diguanylate cyclase (GGDEF)-like protein